MDACCAKIPFISLRVNYCPNFDFKRLVRLGFITFWLPSLFVLLRFMGFWWCFKILFSCNLLVYTKKNSCVSVLFLLSCNKEYYLSVRGVKKERLATKSFSQNGFSAWQGNKRCNNRQFVRRFDFHFAPLKKGETLTDED